MVDVYGDIKAFHERFGLTYDGPPRALPEDLDGFRIKFMGEELSEYVSSDAEDHKSIRGVIGVVLNNSLAPPLEKQLDALVDLVYVALGTAYLHGFDFDEAWRRVHAANMKKVRAQHAKESARGSTNDVVKPPGWTPPDLSDLVR